MKTIIRQGRVVTATDDYHADILIEDDQRNQDDRCEDRRKDRDRLALVGCEQNPDTKRGAIQIRNHCN